MRFGAVAVVGLMAAAVAQAQTGSASTAQASRYVIVGSGCPGQLMARQQTNGVGTVWATALEDKDKKDRSRAPGSMGVHVEFEGAKTNVQALELSVSYLPPGMRLMPVDPKQRTKDTREDRKTFVLKQEAAMHIDGDLMVGPAATITRVHLASVTYADGSMWRAPSEDACTVEPNRVLPVNAFAK
ncbi:MAG TPA: hypothetical protein VGM11_12160 [Acidobacteriaceae bacterium]|jgi:hypothetical protein